VRRAMSLAISGPMRVAIGTVLTDTSTVMRLQAHLDGHLEREEKGPETSAAAPLRRILVYRSRDTPYWHLVTDGLTNLDGGGEVALGWGLELALRVGTFPPPRAAVALLEAVARDLVRARGRIEPGDSFDVDAAPGAVFLRHDPAIPALSGGEGAVRFFEILPIEEADLEEDAEELESRLRVREPWDFVEQASPQVAPVAPALTWDGAPGSVDEAWTRIETALDRLKPGLSRKLAPPASHAALAAARLTSELHALFARHDGEREPVKALAGWQLLRLGVALRESLAAAHYTAPGAIAFATNGAGDFVVVDVDGALGRGAGAVALAFHDEPAPIVVADGLTHWLWKAAEKLTRARLDDDGIVELSAEDLLIERY
jgi:cell wall assembly regulator SMI1